MKVVGPTEKLPPVSAALRSLLASFSVGSVFSEKAQSVLQHGVQVGRRHRNTPLIYHAAHASPCLSM